MDKKSKNSASRNVMQEVDSLRSPSNFSPTNITPPRLASLVVGWCSSGVTTGSRTKS